MWGAAVTEMKRCTRCGEEKPATRDAFYGSSTGKNGLTAACKECTKAAEQSRRDAKPKQPRKKRQKVSPPEFKTCGMCKEIKPRTIEHFSSVRKDLFHPHSYCRTCLKEYQASHYKSSPEALEAQKRRTNPPPPIKEKSCTKCGQCYPATKKYFSKHGSGTAGLNPQCKKCRSGYSKARYQDIKNHDPEKWEQMRAKEIQRRRENPERARASTRKWQTANAEKVRSRAANDRAKRRAVEGSWTGKDLKELFAAQNGCCLYCGVKVGSGRNEEKWNVDHFIPISRGGTNWPSNLRIACQTCNFSKHDKMPWEWMPERFSPPNEQAAD